MFRRPNFFLLCVIRLPSWKHRLFLPIPIFLVDLALEAVEDLLWVLAIATIQNNMRGGRPGPEHVLLTKTLPSVREAWRKIRLSGSYTLVDVLHGSGLKIYIKLL